MATSLTQPSLSLVDLPRSNSARASFLGCVNNLCGFARRFTGYKRPELIFHNPER